MRRQRAVSTPVGFGAEMGKVWMATSYQPRARHSDSLTGGLIDVTGAPGADARFVVGASVAYEFRR